MSPWREPSPRQQELLVPNETLLALYRAHTRMRIDKAKQQLGYRPHFDFEQGMVFTAEYLRGHDWLPRFPLRHTPNPSPKRSRKAIFHTG